LISIRNPRGSISSSPTRCVLSRAATAQAQASMRSSLPMPVPWRCVSHFDSFVNPRRASSAMRC